MALPAVIADPVVRSLTGGSSAVRAFRQVGVPSGLIHPVFDVSHLLFQHRERGFGVVDSLGSRLAPFREAGEAVR